ncbi:RNA-directed DNA polymerase from mobile element jockey [Nephila pilipes]|uniref:RNA-directed DNA polymerase from mobile element jockey n=1 Tax=Nephila pilipes TaxID=299642 RepID=A0A8X6NMX9_NEPPI|nr:RNA-directed DNA polymerase from mobile element jockey [Nephila pilipes]
MPLLKRTSMLNLRNKRLVYLQFLRPFLLYACEVWGATSTRNINNLQLLQNRALRIIANAPVYIPRRVLHDDLRIPSIPNQIRKNSVNFQKSVRLHSNPSIQQQTDPGPSTTYRFPHLATQCPNLFPD